MNAFEGTLSLWKGTRGEEPSLVIDIGGIEIQGDDSEGLTWTLAVPSLAQQDATAPYEREQKRGLAALLGGRRAARPASEVDSGVQVGTRLSPRVAKQGRQSEAIATQCPCLFPLPPSLRQGQMLLRFATASEMEHWKLRLTQAQRALREGLDLPMTKVGNGCEEEGVEPAPVERVARHVGSFRSSEAPEEEECYDTLASLAHLGEECTGLILRACQEALAAAVARIRRTLPKAVVFTLEASASGFQEALLTGLLLGSKDSVTAEGLLRKDIHELNRQLEALMGQAAP